MGFIEILFMATLGALFVLLALLIYHYKRQLNKLESKYDTMFEIINSLVKEVYQCKSDISASKTDRIQNIQYTLPNKTTPAYMLDHFVAGLPLTKNIMNDSDSEGSESEDGDSSVDEEDSEEDEPKQEEYKHFYMTEFQETEFQETHDVQEKPEELLNQEYKQIFITAEPEKEPEVINIVLKEESDPVLEVEELDIQVPPPVAPVPPQAAAAPAAEEDNDDIISVLTNDRRKPYSKMNLQELKQEVQNMGITTDISKMKKQEIVQLLRNHKHAESS